MAKADELASALEHAGYMSDLNENEAAKLREAIAADGLAGALDHPTRVAITDSEDLAEGGVGDWLDREIAPLLEAHGITIAPYENRFPEDASGYSVVLGDKEYWMWREGDVQNSWGTATVAGFELVNDILEKAGARERLHLLGGGNDGTAWLLTPEQAQVIRDVGGVPLRERPYIPVNDGTDWFGQPH